MNKDEMIEEMAKVLCALPLKCKECVYAETYCIMKQEATVLYNAGYRKVGDDEIVIKKEDADYITELYREKIGQVEKWRNLCELKIKETAQETAREILQELYDEAMRTTNEVVELTAFEIKQLAKEKGIELEQEI